MWSADQVERRFGSQRRRAELAELAGTLDGMLDRISAVLRHERLSAELSHELRIPLAGIDAPILERLLSPVLDNAVRCAAGTVGIRLRRRSTTAAAPHAALTGEVPGRQ